jgi:hydrogenase expression/formation protein HypE
MEKVVYKSLGSKSESVLVGPARGFDNTVISIGARKRMVLTIDPVSIIPALGMELSAWLSVHLIASDYTTSGLKPEFATFCFNLPKELSKKHLADYIHSVGKECQRLGVSIVGGHTGSYPGGGFTVVGGGTMFGFSNEGEYIDNSMARAGDVVLMTKGAAIEATALLTLSFPKYAEKTLGHDLAGKAKALVRNCSTVTEATIASSFGLGTDGVTSMHDATEGGVIGGLDEMVSACGKAAVIEKERVHVPEECEKTCQAFGIDPLGALSEGTLLITCNPSSADDLSKSLRREGIATYAIGHIMNGRGLWVSERGKSPRRTKPEADEYWKAYRKSMEARFE